MSHWIVERVYSVPPPHYRYFRYQPFLLLLLAGTYQGTCVAITHDRYFLDNVAGWILEVDKGQCMPYQGNYTAWLEHKASRLTKEDAQEEVR